VSEISNGSREVHPAPMEFLMFNGNREGNGEGQNLHTLRHFWGARTVPAASSSQAPQVSAAPPLRGNPLECKKNKFKTENKTP